MTPTFPQFAKHQSYPIAFFDTAPLALRAAKLSISKGLDMELDDALQWEIKCYEKLLPTSDRREALEAFKDKRKPVFKGI